MSTHRRGSNPHRLLSTLENIEQRSVGADNARRYTRRSLRGEAMLHSLANAGEPRARAVQLRNICLTGIGFLSSEPIEVGSLWRIDFIERGFALGHQAVSIRHCEAISEGVYMCGGQFCIEPGVLHVLGVDPHLSDGSQDEAFADDDFLPPDDAG